MGEVQRDAEMRAELVAAQKPRPYLAASFELQARHYELLASRGGTLKQSSVQLREQASHARSQAQLYSLVEPVTGTAPTAPVCAEQSHETAERGETR